MAIKYHWQITNLDCVDEVVLIAYWERHGKDGDAEGVFNGSTELKTGKKIKPLSELTEGDVIAWVDAIEGDRFDSKVAAQIADRKAPSLTSVPLPWVKEPETSETIDDLV